MMLWRGGRARAGAQRAMRGQAGGTPQAVLSAPLPSPPAHPAHHPPSSPPAAAEIEDKSYRLLKKGGHFCHILNSGTQQDRMAKYIEAGQKGGWGRHAVQCSAVQRSAARCGAVQCGAVRCSAVQCGAVRCGAVQCSAVQCRRAGAALAASAARAASGRRAAAGAGLGCGGRGGWGAGRARRSGRRALIQCVPVTLVVLQARAPRTA